MDQLIRTFIAIDLDPLLQEALGKIQQDFKKIGADVKWVKPSHIHVTLKFLGGISSEQVGIVKKVMQDSLAKFKAFPMNITRIGAFPKVENPHIIWVGIDPEQHAVADMAVFLEKRLSENDFQKESRDFEPHITLGRMKHSLNRLALTQALKAYSLSQPLTQFVQEVKFFKSTLTPTGPVYEVLNVVKLKI